MGRFNRIQHRLPSLRMGTDAVRTISKRALRGVTKAARFAKDWDRCFGWKTDHSTTPVWEKIPVVPTTSTRAVPDWSAKETNGGNPAKLISSKKIKSRKKRRQQKSWK